LCNPRHLSSVVDEHYFINDTFSQMQLVTAVVLLELYSAFLTIDLFIGEFFLSPKKEAIYCHMAMNGFDMILWSDRVWSIFCLISPPENDSFRKDFCFAVVYFFSSPVSDSLQKRTQVLLWFLFFPLA